MPRLFDIQECKNDYSHPSLWERREPSWSNESAANSLAVPKLSDFMDDIYPKAARYPRCLFHDVILLWACQAIVEHKPSDSPVRRLEDAAKNGDERAFLLAFKGTEWEDKSPEDFVYATKLALKAGAHLAAREISKEALVRYPDNRTIQKYARGLAAPRIISRHLPANPSLRANREWLKDHSKEYCGRWVAVRNGELLASASSLAELNNQVLDKENTLFTRVR